MEQLITLFCDCEFHKLEIEEFIINKTEGTFLDFSIYEYKSTKTGKLYKKPKLLAYVVLSPEQVKLFKSAFKNE